jgi:hypothetical protein
VSGKIERRPAEALPALEVARRVIAQAVLEHDADTLRELRSRASAVELYNRRTGAMEIANDAGEIKVRAERGLGQVDAAVAPHGGDRMQGSGTGILTDVRRETRAAWRRLGKVADVTFEHSLELAHEDELAGVSTASILSIVRLGGVLKSTTFECQTPARYVEAAREVLGAIDLDPASDVEANRTVKAARFHHEDDDGLAHDWHGRVFLNPPYGRFLTAAFATHLVEQYDVGNVTAAVLVLNAYGFDAQWFRPLFAHTLCFTDHRVPFYGGGPTFGSLFFYLGPERARFARVFGRFGDVVVRLEEPAA